MNDIDKCRKIIDKHEVSKKLDSYCATNKDGGLVAVDLFMASAYRAGIEDAKTKMWEEKFGKVISSCPCKDLLYSSLYTALEKVKFVRNPDKYLKRNGTSLLTKKEDADCLNSGEEIESGGMSFKLINGKICRIINKAPHEVTHDVESFLRMHHCFAKKTYDFSIFDLEDGKEYCARGDTTTYRRNGDAIEYMCNTSGEWKRASFHAGVPMFALT